MIAAIHLAYTFITVETGSSWDTVSELVMLALNTRIPSHIQNTSAGVATLSTLRELVTIKADSIFCNKHFGTCSGRISKNH